MEKKFFAHFSVRAQSALQEIGITSLRQLRSLSLKELRAKVKSKEAYEGILLGLGELSLRRER